MLKFSCTINLIFFLRVCLVVHSQSIDNSLSLQSLGDEQMRQQNWQSATESFLKLSQENPYHPEYMFNLGYAAYRLKNYNTAISYFKMAINIGHDFPGTPNFLIARCFALLNNPDSSVWYCKQAIKGGQTEINSFRNNPDFASIVSNPGFSQLVGTNTSVKASRDEKWKYDLEYIRMMAPLFHFNLYGTVDSVVWNKAIDRIDQRIPSLTDNQVIGELMKLIALLKDGHSKVVLPYEILKPKYHFHKLPVQLYYFNDGYFIISAEKEHGNLVGKRLVEINNIPIKRVVESLRSYFGYDNDQNFIFYTEIALNTPEILRMVNATDSDTQASYTLEDEKGVEEKITLQASRILNTGQVDLEFENGWINMNDNAKQPVPLWLSNQSESFWNAYLSDQQIIYVQINAIVNTVQQSFEQFCKSLFSKTVPANNPKAVIIDLRLNGGGSSFFNRHLIEEIIKSNYNQKEKLFVLTSRLTFSAAQNLVTDLEYWTNAMFIGTPSGSAPNFIGESTSFRLPYSDLMITISSTLHQGGVGMSIDKRKWIPPDVTYEMTADDFKVNRDRILEMIFEYLKN